MTKSGKNNHVVFYTTTRMLLCDYSHCLLRLFKMPRATTRMFFYPIANN